VQRRAPGCPSAHSKSCDQSGPRSDWRRGGNKDPYLPRETCARNLPVLGCGWESGRPHGWPACTSLGPKLRPSLVGFSAASLAEWGLSYSLVTRGHSPRVASRAGDLRGDRRGAGVRRCERSRWSELIATVRRAAQQLNAPDGVPTRKVRSSVMPKDRTMSRRAMLSAGAALPQGPAGLLSLCSPRRSPRAVAGLAGTQHPPAEAASRRW
jgi:hypothetical protein